MVSIAVYFPDREDGSGALLGGVFAFATVALGLFLIARARTLPRRSGLELVRLFALSIIVGIALGITNLVVNRAIASIDIRIYEQMVRDWAGYSSWSMIVADPLLEEIAFRLALMSVTAWVLARFTDDRRTIFIVVLLVSSVLFGLAHILPSSRPAVSAVHGIAVALKSGAAGALLGWIFWRWGLPYSYACHSTANATHLLAAPLLF